PRPLRDQRRRGGAPDPARSAGDRDHLPIQRSQAFCHFPVPPVDVPLHEKRYRVGRSLAKDWLTSQSTPKGILKSMGFFRYDGHKRAYTVHGRGARTTVLTPALLLSQKMQTPLAADLAGHGNRVVTFDFLGHGASDRPEDMTSYSMPEFARQTVALLD